MSPMPALNVYLALNLSANSGNFSVKKFCVLRATAHCVFAGTADCTFAGTTHWVNPIATDFPKTALKGRYINSPELALSGVEGA